MAENQVDVQKIMGEIKAEIAEKGLVNDIPAFGDVVMIQPEKTNGIDTENLRKKIDALEGRKINFHRKLTSHFKIISPFVKFVKFITQKLCRFIIEPIAGEINSYHKHLTNVLRKVENMLSSVSERLNSFSYLEDEIYAARSNQILLKRDYEQIVNQYAASNLALENELTKANESLRKVEQLQEDYEHLKLRLEYAEMDAKILKKKLERLEFGREKQ